MKIENALYIKLGEGGCWEKDSIENGKIRIGWKNIPLDLIKNNEWDKIRKLHDDEHKDQPNKKGVATTDFNALQKIIRADDRTVFITFFSGKMYWCVAKNGSINEDSISKYVETEINWSDKSINAERMFTIDTISGRLAKYRGYRATCCSVGNNLNEFEYLTKIISNIETSEYKNVFEAKEKLKASLVPAIKNLIPGDFEILVDLIFRNFGWKRVSVLGKTMKFFDIMLEEPLKKTLHGVQIKSKAGFADYEHYKNEFIENYQNDFGYFFFVVHTPDKKLKDYIEKTDNIYKFTIEEIADHAIDSGLTGWIMEKAR